MPLRRYLRDDFRFILFCDLFQAKYSSPTQKREAMQILEGAVEFFGVNGLNSNSLSSIAKRCGVSKSKLLRYYAGKEELVLESVKYTRFLYQSYVVEESSGKPSSVETLEKYIESSVRWPSYFPNHVALWLAFLRVCSLKPHYREINTQSVEVGYSRVLHIIETGQKNGEFSPGDLESKCRAIHHMLTGLILSLNTETDTRLEKEIDEIKRRVFSILGC